MPPQPNDSQPPRTETDADDRYLTAAEAEEIAKKMIGPCPRCER